VVFTVQEGREGDWRRVVDTGLSSPDDIAEAGKGHPVSRLDVPVQARSILVLEQ
jgi:hypothetical protein